MNLLVENPVTRRRVSVSPPAFKSLSPLVRDRAGALAEKLGIDEEPAATILHYLGWPKLILGEGAFGLVFEHPSRKDQVLKLTSDPIDGITASRIAMLQKTEARSPEPNITTVTAKLHAVERIRLADDKYFRSVWALTVERLVPLDTFPRNLVKLGYGSAKDQRAASLALDVMQNYFDSNRYHDVQAEVYEELQDAPEVMVWPKRLRGEMRKVIRWYANKIYQKAIKEQERSILASRVLAKMAMGLEMLLARNLLLIDMHKWNWGVRGRGAKRFDVVALDFGMSSPDKTGAKAVRYDAVLLAEEK